MERTQPDPAHEDPQPSPLARARSQLDAQANQMLREMADRLELHRPDERLSPTGRIALIQATTMAPPLARRLRAKAPEITALITRRDYAKLLREIAGPAEPPQQRELPPSTPWTADRTADAAELLQRARVDYARAQARREQLLHEDRVHGHEPGGDH